MDRRARFGERSCQPPASISLDTGQDADSLQSENAMLHLKIAKLVEELRRQGEKVTYLSNKVGDLMKERRQWNSWLTTVKSSLNSLKADYEDLRGTVQAMPQEVQVQCHRVQDHIETKCARFTNASREIEQLQDQLEQKDLQLAEASDKLAIEKHRRRLLHNTVMELRGNIRVYCRVRPVVECDRRIIGYPIPVPGSPSKAIEPVVEVVDEESVAVRTGRTHKIFEYERVYGPDDSQEKVFTEVEPLVTSLLDGYNVCVMAYGQTGSGKTHTMMGSHQNEEYCLSVQPQVQEGIIPRAIRELFRLISEKPLGMHTVEISVVEIYNNELRDLLAVGNNTSKHDIIMGVDGAVHVPSVAVRPVEGISEVMKVIRQAMHHRSETATQIHEHSSRSHLIMMVTVTTYPGMDSGDTTPTGTRSAVGSSIPRMTPVTVVNGGSRGASAGPSTSSNYGDSAPRPLSPPSPRKYIAHNPMSHQSKPMTPPSPKKSLTKQSKPMTPPSPRKVCVPTAAPRTSSLSSSPKKVNGMTSGQQSPSLTPPSPTKRKHSPGGAGGGGMGSPTTKRSQIPVYSAVSDTRSRSPSPLRKSSFLSQRVVRTKLQLVDLAGSECVGMSGATGEKLRETAHINRSLCALSDVLGALAENRGHVPYRNSKLTHLLQDSIGGDAKLLVVVCVSPSRRQMAETLQTLGFGQRARQVQRGPVRKRSSSSPGALSPNGDVLSSPKPLRARSASLKAL